MREDPLTLPEAMRPDVTIYFIRHGETEWNAEARYQGQADIPMNARGRAQANRNGESLRPLLPAIATADYVASPLPRARETMEIVRGVMGLGLRFPHRRPPEGNPLRRLAGDLAPICRASTRKG